MSNSHLIKLGDFLKDVSNSYNSVQNIHNQFHKDFPRETISLNGYKYHSIELFSKHLNDLVGKCKKTCVQFGKSSKNNVRIKMDDIVKLICCQSSFALIYQILAEKYSDENTILTSISGKSKIDIAINVTSIIAIKLKIQLFLMNTNTGTVTNILKVQLSFTINPTTGQNDDLVVMAWSIKSIPIFHL